MWRMRNLVTDETVALRRDVAHEHPAWVHSQLGTDGDEIRVQRLLDNTDPDLYVEHGEDENGLSWESDEA